MKNFLFKKLNIFAISIFLFLSSNSQAQQFRAAVSKVNITPHNSQQLLGYGARKSTAVR